MDWVGSCIAFVGKTESGGDAHIRLVELVDPRLPCPRTEQLVVFLLEKTSQVCVQGGKESTHRHTRDM